MRIKNLSLSQDLLVLHRFLKLTQVSFFATLRSFLLALLAMALQGINYVLMVPVLQALISRNVDFILHAQRFAFIVEKLPPQMTASTTQFLFALSGIIFLNAFLKNIVQVIYEMYGRKQSQSILSRLRFLIYERYLSFGKSFFDQRSLGTLQHILMNHPRYIADGLRVLQKTFYALVMLSISLFIMLRISWRLVVITLILWPIFNLFLNGISRQIRNASIESSRVTARLTRWVSNVLSCMPLIKASSFEEMEKARFLKPNEEVDKVGAKVAWKKFLIGPAQEMSGLLIIFILLGLLAYELVDRNTSHMTGAYLVFFLILRRSMPLLGTFTRLGASIAAMRGPLDELEDLFSDQHKFFVQAGNSEFGQPRNEIRFERLSFTYPNQKPPAYALKEVSFKAKAGEVTALVGPTGAGKTTLIHLLMRFYDCPPGTIFVDGQDLRDFSLKSFHKRVAFISQESLLFNETIRFNLNYGLEAEAPEAAMAEALKQARMDVFTRRLHKGLDTLIGDRGVRLSGGEKQRLSIARALLRNADILILDEATSSLDGETEQLIQEAIMSVTRGRTTLVVAHRFSTIRGADHIVVLEEGCVVEEGSLKKLLEVKGLFRKLWEAQRFY